MEITDDYRQNSLSEEEFDSLGKSEKPILITQSPIMKDLLYKVRLAAKTNATILVTGENGTGKDVLARLIHYYSPRSKESMVAINCGAIPAELVESELFGHERGAFTGASTMKEGCFELANGGTLFLDEIGDMPLPIQVKLLRAVELSSFRRIGGKKEINVDVRLISATNKILIDQVRAGSFREELFYRLDIIELYVPPLRHRKEDIYLLLDYYKKYFAEKHSKAEIDFPDESIEMLMSYDWPGNVRELKNIVERCVVLSDSSKLDIDLIPAHINRHNGRLSSVLKTDKNYIQIPVGTSLEEVEREVIDKTLTSVDNNKTEAAKILGFSRKTLHNKLDKYDTKNI